MMSEPAIEMNSRDRQTADAFATSWNHLPSGSVYSTAQFEDWFAPLERSDLEGKRVLELGCGNGSLLTHVTAWRPEYLTGVDLGASVDSCRENMKRTTFQNYEVVQDDLATFFRTGGFDVVYCIGVLHHLKDPLSGFASVIRNTKRGGRFHCWVYAKEGNAIIRYVVDPIRKVASRLPWWFTKYLIATPLAVPFYFYAHLVSGKKIFHRFPLHEYCNWIVRRPFAFFRHVAFDQLVTPQTAYIDKATIGRWLAAFPEIDPESVYVIFRNGNSWKFGGMKRGDSPA